MAKSSAGILMYRRSAGDIEVLLVHHGGPYWANKDLGAWSIPKGEIEPNEDPLAAARREFLEETGHEAGGPFELLPPATQRSGKIIAAWAAPGTLDERNIVSSTFSMEWPPRSGRMQEFPEVDRAAWFSIEEARSKLNPGQVPFLDALLRALERGP